VSFKFIGFVITVIGPLSSMKRFVIEENIHHI